MTGPENYREAELLLETGCEYGCPHSGCEHELVHVARAQAHATLALAAATAMATYGNMPVSDNDAWFDAASGAS